MNIKKIILSAGMLFLAAHSPLYAADYPTRPIRLIVPFAPGGNTDVAGRMIAEGMGKQLGQSIVVENKGGAGGSIGAGVAARANPDGYTILLASSALTIIPAIYKEVSYDIAKDFDPVGLAMETSLVLAAAPQLGVKTVDELIAAAKAKPGTLTYSSAGVGSGSHLAGELFTQVAKIKTVHVPYKGSGPATSAILSNEVNYTFTSLAAALPLVQSQNIVALAITSKERSPLYPNVPSSDEVGLQGFYAGDWLGLAAPAGTPKEAITRLNAALQKWLDLPGTKEQLAKQGFTIKTSSPQEFRDLIGTELVKWKGIATKAGITAQ
ncbi:Argininosuccinate lyase [Achromobacter xylosoxidans]|uniref:Bug family tripartite tricarboxylate transporter substrate binding protein n=1 Tax=Alcaligenes xylosoxydans xylosoxydans TaxID=85698 RepID=UPI0006BFF520|nr:tripartite tricarboxylate transporter substrate binding protein [Achromobacter xylosoxidans]CUJ65914.1 Argininosuccinate lyase [Achromobacter xylosoxidans]